MADVSRIACESERKLRYYCFALSGDVMYWFLRICTDQVKEIESSFGKGEKNKGKRIEILWEAGCSLSDLI